MTLVAKRWGQIQWYLNKDNTEIVHQFIVKHERKEKSGMIQSYLTRMTVQWIVTPFTKIEAKTGSMSGRRREGKLV